MMLRFLPLIVLLAACATEPLTPEEQQAMQAEQYCSTVAGGGVPAQKHNSIEVKVVRSAVTTNCGKSLPTLVS